MIHKTTRSILSVLLAALLLVTSTPLTPAFAGGGAVSPQSANSARGGLEQDGDGTYLIYTAENLKEFAVIVNGTAEGIDQNTSANAKLMNDIDLTSVCGESLNGGTSWNPIGSDSSRYSGTFNGDGHTISGLYIDSNADYQGLFGYLSTDGDNIGTVKDLTVSGTVSGGMFVGGVVGYNRGRVENCHNIGSVSGNRSVGGVVGSNNNGSVENCHNIGEVSGLDSGSDNSVGGIVGRNDGTVKNCYNTGKVTGSSSYSYIGGVVGNNYSGTVENCYNTGSVNSSGNRVGGVVGWNSSSGTVTNCYNTGAVSGGVDVGGVVGYNGGTVTGCYFLKTDDVNKDLQGIGNDEDAEGAAAVNDLSDLCEALENDDTWTTSPFCEHPVLQANPEGGDGTAAHPYEIKTAAQLETFRDIVNDENGQVKDSDAHAKLMNDIDLKDVCGKDAGESEEEVSWEPIGTSSKPYTGTFNGDGHTISGLYIAGDDDDQGLFGYVSGSGKIEKLSVSGDINGGMYVGGVVGYNDGTVTGCIFSGSGSVSGSYYVGGVVGDNRGSVINCTNTGSVKGSDHVGGVVGDNIGSVTNCYNIGSVTSSGSPVGGVVGSNGSNGVVENCHNAVKVSGSVNSVGGVVGDNSGTVENCTNTGAVSGSGMYVGGVVGDNSGSVTNCYNTDKVTGSSNFSYTGGVVGDNSGSVENCYNTGNISGGSLVGGVVGYNDGDSVTNCYNTGSVSDGTYTGGVVGYNISSTVTGCYFLKGTAESGIGENVGSGDATEKDDTAFHSGEVAWRLQAGQADGSSQVWGQSNLKDKNSWPTLIALDKNAKTVYQVTLKYDHAGAQDKTYYTDDTATPSEQPSRDGYTFDHWDKTEGEGNTITYTAQWTPVADPDPEPEEPPYSGKYSYEIATDIGDNGAISVDRYATEGDKVTIDVTPDQAYKLDELVVTANGKDVELTANSDGTYTFTMPSADVKITATFAEDPDWTEPEPEPSTDVSDLFIDVAPNAWYKDAVQYAYDNGLMTGVSATEFAPEQTTTRAMIVSILARLENVTTAQAAGFADVNDEWYATAVNWAANVGVVNGYEDNTFKPNTAITREQLAAILMNYAAYKGEDVSNRASLATYTDQPSTWATETMSWAVAEGLINGVTNDQLQPQGNATRAQVAAILQRFLSE